MFSKWGSGEAGDKPDGNGKKDVQEEMPVEKTVVGSAVKEAEVKPVRSDVRQSGVNTILKGSKLIGDINVTCDLELSGDVEGNIRSIRKSNIVIKGTCTGNIETSEGSVDIVGELKGGNIIAGENVTISGKFNGGEVKANGRIYVNGEFNGKLEANEVEIGANACGKGEVFYKENISISKGAKVEVQIARLQGELKVVKGHAGSKPADMKPQQQNIEKAN